MRAPRWLYWLPLQFQVLFGRKRVESDLEEEMRFHLEMQADQNRQRGMDERAANLAARRQFGNATIISDECRDVRRTAPLEALVRDFLHAFRTLRRTPGFTAIAVLSLALGIGASSALFSVVDAVLLKPLPLRDPDRVIWLQEFRNQERVGGNPMRLADWSRASSFEAVSGVYGESNVLTGRGQPERVNVLRTIGEFFAVTGVPPVLGRAPTISESKAQEQPVAVISYSFWLSKFCADRGALGQILNLDGVAHTIIGVMPNDRVYPDDVDIWSPAPAGVQRSGRASGFLGLVARVKPGISLSQAQAEVDTISAALARQHPETDRDRKAVVSPLLENIAEEVRPALIELFVTMLTVLLVACINVSGLMLARGLSRQREAGIRMALGSGAAGLVRLFLMESAAVAAVSSVAGIMVAGAGVDFLRSLDFPVPRLATATLDWRVLTFALATAAVCTLICGLVPALHAARAGISGPLKEGGMANFGGGSRGGRLRAGFVASAIAVSMVLLTGATVLTSSFLAMRRQPLGFNPAGAMSFQVDFSWGSPSPRLVAFSNAALENLQSAPGIQSAGIIDRLPLAGGTQTRLAIIRGREIAGDLAETPVSWRMASASYFAAAQVPLLEGEMYPQRWDSKQAKVAVVNHRFARAFFGDASPVGQWVAMQHRSAQSKPGADATWYRIIGVVADVRHAPADLVPAMEVYIPWGETYWPLHGFVVRGSLDSQSMQATIRKAIHSANPDAIIEELRPLEAHVASTRFEPALRASLVSGFATFALLLASIGLYGLLSQEVTRRRQEFGLRIALGAAPRSILTNALQRGLKLTAIGLALGMLLSLAVSRWLESLLFGAGGGVVPQIALAALIMLGVGTLACALPARRAAKVDPLTALRCE